MKKLVAAILCFVLVMTGCSKNTSELPKDGENTKVTDEDHSFQYLSDEFREQVLLQSSTSDSYTNAYMKEADRYLQEKKRADAYSLGYPLFVENPYGTMPGSIYFYMGEINWKPYVSYQVSVPGTQIPDFTESLYIREGGMYAVEGIIIGLIEGVINTVEITVKDEAGNLVSQKTYTIDLQKNEVPEGLEQVLIKTVKGTAGLSAGLFCTANSWKSGCGYLFYDMNGILRARICTQEPVQNAILLKAGNNLFYAAGRRIYVLADRYGKIIQSFSFGNKEEIQDYQYDELNRRILLLTRSEETKDLNLYSLLTEQGEMERIFEFESQDQLSMVADELSAGKVTMQLLDDSELLLASSQNSVIFRIGAIDKKPVVRWMLGECKKSYTKESIMNLDGPIQNYEGIRSIFVSSDKKMKEDSFYMKLFSTADGQEYYSNYYVEEGTKAYNVTELYSLGESEEIRTIQVFGTNIIISRKNEIQEYSSEGKRLLSLSFQKDSAGYAEKINMARCWF